MGFLCPRKLFHTGLCRERFGVTGEQHEDTGNPEQKGVERET